MATYTLGPTGGGRYGGNYPGLTDMSADEFSAITSAGHWVTENGGRFPTRTGGATLGELADALTRYRAIIAQGGVPDLKFLIPGGGPWRNNDGTYGP